MSDPEGLLRDECYCSDRTCAYCEAEAEVISLRSRLDRVFQMLEVHGVPRDRCKGDAANGIDVLATRYSRDLHDMTATANGLASRLHHADLMAAWIRKHCEGLPGDVVQAMHDYLGERVVETPVFFGVDIASGPDRTVYHCARCGWTGEGAEGCGTHGCNPR